jgi:hypothetical protein
MNFLSFCTDVIIANQEQSLSLNESIQAVQSPVTRISLIIIDCDELPRRLLTEASYVSLHCLHTSIRPCS